MKKIKCPTLRLNVVTLFVLIFCMPAYSATKSKPSQSSNDFYLSLGNLCEYVGKIQTDSNGGKNFCSFTPSLSLNYDYFVIPDFALSPEIGATLPKSGRDSNIKTMTLYALMNGKYKTSYVNFIVGAGVYLTRIWGPGGDETLNNGNSSDSFPLPKDPVYTRNFIVNLGVSNEFSQDISGELYTYIFNALKKEDRSFSLGFSLSYHFGEIL
ncbi:MAG: hypothetical protein H7336_00565 [Bacteriovorax sp.]|nr:hypothetical protein [Bacteriovorax sp.]